VPDDARISDKALAVFAFAIYHQLESGSRVKQVVRDDRAGHHADEEAIAELQGLGLVQAEGDRIGFTERGEAFLDRTIAEMRAATSSPAG
jgi:ribosomal protein S19E (S16A)